MFSDGILPGEGTSASENDDTNIENGLGLAEKKKYKKKMLSRSKHGRRHKSLAKVNAITQANLALIDKENFLFGEKVLHIIVFIACAYQPL